MFNWLKHLTDPPTIEDREPAQGHPIVALGMGVAGAHFLSGDQTSDLNKAMFVALPFVVNAAAEAGVRAGMESREADSPAE